MKTKTCSRCGIIYQKPLEQNFRKYKKAKDGLSYWCNICADKYNKKYLKTKKGGEARKQACKNYRLSKKGIVCQKKYAKSANGKEYYAKIQRKHLLKKYYGLTVGGYNILFENQQGCCAICGKHQSELKKRLFVDHDHKTGFLRGLLCNKCNLWLAPIEDVTFKIAAEEYLKNA